MGPYQKSLATRLSGGTAARPRGHTGMLLDTNTPRTGLAIVIAVMYVLAVGPLGYAASSGERVTFKSADSIVSAPISATVYRPKGTGPFPGVVLLHVCSGIRPYDSKWAEWLGTLGYLTILPDSLSPRQMSTGFLIALF